MSSSLPVVGTLLKTGGCFDVEAWICLVVVLVGSLAIFALKNSGHFLKLAVWLPLQFMHFGSSSDIFKQHLV